MKKVRSIKSSTKQMLLIAITVFLLLTISFICSSILLVGNVKTKYKMQLNTCQNVIEENRRTVYEVIQSIAAGEILTEENTVIKEVYSSLNQDLYATQMDIGKSVSVNLSEGEYITKSMILNEEYNDNDREIEYEAIKLNANISINDYVDVRIVYPNGEDYVVLAKKQIKQADEANVICYLWNNEEEIQLLSSAIVDAYLYEGAYLYMTRYVYPEVQEPSVVTYIPLLSTIKLIENSPNIVNIASKYLNSILRKELENRLANSMATSVENIEWKIEKDKKPIEEITRPKDDFTTFKEQEKDKKETEELGE